MKQTINKVFFAWDFEKEEEWLNAMSKRGSQLVDVGFCKYFFEEGTAGEYNYRIELLENLPTHQGSKSYIRFLEESGVEHIGSYFRWVYLRRTANDSEFDLFSDIDSRIKHLKRILTLLLCLIPLEFSALGMNISTATMGSTINLICACLLILVFLVPFFGIAKLWKKIRELKKERILHE